MRRLLLVFAASMALTACSASSSSSASFTPRAAPSAAPDLASPAAIAICESVPITAPPEEAFGDSPIYVGNEMPEDEIGEWARTRPGFEVLWIDRAHAGWVVVAFSSDVTARQAELVDAFPDAGVVAIQVDWKMADLERLQQRVSDALRSRLDSFSVGIDVMRGMVTVGLGVLSPERMEAVRSLFGDEPVCVEGLDPSQAIPEAPQPISGDGWRLLANEATGDVYRTGIATDAASYQALWEQIGLAGERPPVDFDAEVVVWFGAVYGSSCPDIRLDDVVSDVDRRLLHGRIVRPSTQSVCTADANPRAYVVAVERSLLPPPPFGIQLGSEDPPAGVPEERTIVEADLRVPGSVVQPGDVHGDPNLPEPYVVESGSIIEPDFGVSYRLDVRCGIEWLGRLNDLAWRTDVTGAEGASLPAEWSALVEDGSVIVEVLLTTEPEPTITASAGGKDVVYRPARSPLPDCP